MSSFYLAMQCALCVGFRRLSTLSGMVYKVLQASFCCQVVADQQLVKHLQQEVARLEAELRSPEPSSRPSVRALLVEKDMKIQKVWRS